MTHLPALIEQAAHILGNARRAVALTGAGVSTPSGIPDFRSPQSGLWTQADPLAAASLQTFRYEPQRFFDWVRPLAELIYHAEPNAAHRALAQLEAMGRLGAVITQNIDELHRRAGSVHVLEIHGSLETATCVQCYANWPGQQVLERFLGDGSLPRCPDCGGLLKPNVTLMGEQLPVAVLQAARRAIRECDVVLVAGSSLEVMPAASLPHEALDHGAQLIIINLQPTYLDEQATVLIHADVAEVLPQLVTTLVNHTYEHN